MTFEEFSSIINNAIAAGEIKASCELTELDLAIQYALGQEMETGRDTFTTDEMPQLIYKHCGEKAYKRIFAE